MWHKYTTRKQHEEGKVKEQKSLFIDLDDDRAIEIKITLTDKNNVDNNNIEGDQFKHYTKLVNEIFTCVKDISFGKSISGNGKWMP